MPQCWACQTETPPADCVEIDDVRHAVCRTCWESIPVGQRIALGQKLRDAVSARQAWEAVKSLIDRHALENDTPDWLKGGRG